MNIHRHVLPVSFAAAFHAALLFGFPGKSAREVVLVTEVPLTPSPPKPPDDIVVPTPEAGETTVPVKPLAGGPPTPDLDPPPGRSKIDDITITDEIRPKNPMKKVSIIPQISGPGDGAFGTGNTGPTIINIRNLDNIPRAKVQPSPDYPTRMKRDGIGGSVIVEFEVNTTGLVVRAEATSCSQREFVEPALRAVRMWRFEPGRKAGKVVPFRMTVPIEFGIVR